MEAEVDRYLGRPAQALGYMVGELKDNCRSHGCRR